MSNKVVMITGALAGIGRATAWAFAADGLSQAAALEAASSGVRVNVVAPGPVDTDRLDQFTGTAERKAGLIAGVPLKRLGTPAEIAASIVFISSDKANFITGAVLSVNGGKTAS